MSYVTNPELVSKGRTYGNRLSIKGPTHYLLVRIPVSVMDKVKADCEKSGLSMSSEIAATLIEAYEGDDQ